MAKKKIIVSVTNDLTTDQRVAKICSTLVEKDYEVLLVGRKLKQSLPLERPYPTKRFKLWFNRGPLFYANYSIRLYCFLLFQQFDALWSNDLDTLWPNFAISKLKKKRLIFDSHEYFTEVPELVGRPKVQGFWKRIERRILPKLSTVFTVSESIAQLYRNEYNIEVKVLRNVPQLKSIDTTAPKLASNEDKVLIYQGALNLGRGIDLMIDAMQFTENAILYIIGTGDLNDEIHQHIRTKKLESKVKLLGEIPGDKLSGYTIQGDLGFSLEEDKGLNYRYALPNKLFNYIHCEVPCLVSDLPEMGQLVKTYQVGEILNTRNAEALALQITNLLNNKEAITQYKENCKKAKAVLNWEHEKNVILAAL